MIPEWVEKWPPGLFDLVKKVSARHGLTPEWVAAVVQKESAGIADRVRYEKHWKYWHNIPVHAKRLGITEESEMQLQAFSWGVMQVMGSVARQWGFSEALQNLTDHEKGLEYGCKHLAHMRRRFSTGRDWIAAYNAGSPRRKPDDSYSNQEYVDSVVRFWNDFNDS